MRRWLHGIVCVVALGVVLLGLQPAALSAELWSDVADTSWVNQHAGTESDPYLIETAEQLAGLSKLVNAGNAFRDKHILLTRDISVAGREWIPVGWMCAYGDLADFAGTLDGGGHAVTGVTISTGEHLPVSPNCFKICHSGAFLGYVAPVATVKNLVLMGAITNKYSNGAAGLTTWSDGNILNCITSFDLMGASPNNAYVAGVASLNGGGLIRNCVAYGSIKTHGAGGANYAGGILGFSYWYQGSLQNCVAMCSEITADMDAGGIVGGFSPNQSEFRYCTSAADKVKANPSYTGGIVGAYGYGWIDCYWLKVNENQPSFGLGTGKVPGGMITDPAKLPVTAVVLDAADVRTMLVGETREVHARHYPPTGDPSGVKYKWSVKGTGLSVLSGMDGPVLKVKAVSEGYHALSLSVTGVLGVPAASDDAALTPGAVLKVVNALPPATGIALGGPGHALKEGEVATLTAAIVPTDAKPEGLTWTVAKAEGQGAVDDLLLEDHGDGTAAVTLKKQYKDGASYGITVQSAGGLSAAVTVWGEALGAEPNVPGFVPIGAMLPGGAEGKRPFGTTSDQAAELISEIGAALEDFRLGGDGLLYPSRARLETVMEELGKAEGIKLSGASPFPLIALEVSKARTLAAVGFLVEGKRFRAAAPKDVVLFEARPKGTGEVFRYAESPRDYLDGHFAVQHEDGTAMPGNEPFVPDKKYGLVVYVRDGGRIDLIPAERRVAASLVLAKNTALSGPTSPDVSPDVKPPVSPDIKPPVSPDVEPPKVPEHGVAPQLPEGTDGKIIALKPELAFGKTPSESLALAAKMLADSGLEKGDLIVDRKTGQVKLNADVGWEVAEKAVSSDGFIDEAKSLPVLTATLPSGASVAAVGLEVTGSALMAEEASGVKVLKVLGPEEGELLKYAGSVSEFGDGRFTVLDGSGRIVGDLSGRGRYVLTLFIEDGGKYDLDGRANGRIVDPALLLSVEEPNASSPKPKPKPGNESKGSGGCNAGLLWGWLLLVAAVPVTLRRRG
ncbi:hypothetical protein FF3_02463 [Fretibacterium fastidiosum]|uniref:Ig-like domain-containing protein n=3 Tax=Fretibacterium fastidiosum TaxID=651822 RepID=UPI0038FC1B30